MDDLSSTQGIVALVAAGVAAIALVCVIVLAVKLRRVRAAQRTILGESDTDLVAHAAKTRSLGAGTIIGSGTVSNQGPDGDPGKSFSEGGAGYSCIAEIRMIEQIASGEAKTGFMKAGDTVRVEMRDAAGHSIFGAIEQRIEPYVR